jgi:hypothetical protein
MKRKIGLLLVALTVSASLVFAQNTAVRLI